MESFFANLVHTALWVLLLMTALSVIGLLAIGKFISNTLNAGKNAMTTSVHDAKIRSKEIVHGDFRASTKDAAGVLDKMFRGSNWYQATGFAGNEIIVYAISQPPVGLVPEDRSGHPVRVIVTGIIRAH